MKKSRKPQAVRRSEPLPPTLSPIFLYLGKIEAGAEYVSELSGKIKTELLP